MCLYADAEDFSEGLNATRLDLLNLLGIDYFTERIAMARRQRMDIMNYRCYVADCLYMISTGLGNKPNERYYDIINPAPKDTRTGEELLRDMCAEYGIEVVG